MMKILIALLLSLVAPSHALDNGLAITPPLGWRSWVRASPDFVY
jgi:hypothetical protein